MYLVVFMIGALLAIWPNRLALLAGQNSSPSPRGVRAVGVLLVLITTTAAVLIA